MAPKTIIHCVRHAQGFHNLSTANHTIRDPLLTALGKEQCTQLASSFAYHDQITHLIASPLRRTIYTTLLSFPNESQHLKIVALPELQETSDLPCDTGSDKIVLEKEFGDSVDLDLVTEGWHDKQAKKWNPAASAIDARAREARLYIREVAQKAHASPEFEGRDVHIAVVTHGGFLHYFTEDWNGHDRFVGTGWANTEWRSYEFVQPEGVAGGDDRASLRELEESRSRRGERPLSEAEQRNLRHSAEKEWQASGYQTPPDTEKPEPIGEIKVAA